MKKEHKMLVLNDATRTITYKKLKGRRTLKFCREIWNGYEQHTNRQYIVIGLFSNDHDKEITYVCRCKDDNQDFTNVFHINVSWRRLKKKLITDYKKSGYVRFY